VPAPVQLRDGGQPHRGLAVAECALQQRQGGVRAVTALRLARGESRVGLEQVRALLPRQARGVHEHLRECRRSISGESGAVGQELDEPVQGVDQQGSRLDGGPRQRVRQHFYRDAGLGPNDQVESRPAHARVGITQARAEGPNRAGVEQLGRVGAGCGQRLCTRGLEQQGRIGAPQGQGQREPERRDRHRREGDERRGTEGEGRQHGAVAQHGTQPVHGALEKTRRRRAQPLGEQVEQHPQCRQRDRVLGQPSCAQGAHPGEQPRLHAEPAEAQQVAGRLQGARQWKTDAMIEPPGEPELDDEHRHVEPAAELRVQGEQPLLGVCSDRRGIRDARELEVEDRAQQSAAQHRSQEQPEQATLPPRLRRRDAIRARASASPTAAIHQAARYASGCDAPQPQRASRRAGQQQGADEHEPFDPHEAGHRVGSKAADDRAEGDAGGQRAEQPLRLPRGDEVREREPEDELAEREHLARDQHERAEHDGDRVRLQQPPQWQEQRRQPEQDDRKRARSVDVGQRPARQHGGDDQESGARQQCPGQLLDADPLEEERLRGVEQRVGGRTEQRQAQSRPATEQPLRRLDPEAAQEAFEAAHGARSIAGARRGQRPGGRSRARPHAASSPGLGSGSVRQLRVPGARRAALA
jgi:hypothetical protein